MSSPRTEKTDQQRAEALTRPHCTECDDHDPYERCHKCRQMREEIQAVLSEVRREEREACALIAANGKHHRYAGKVRACIAAAIRSRQENSNGR